ncbi:MAG TPA: 3-phosphoserine/phosphohydroxythreonine transaminase [Gammaproteobacteria bacterium]|nr:3-phosphoserine/phosphohydroxythreonine transaminase [Gammaproteobacteria bacterium]
MNRVINFSAGPGVLPHTVLESVQQDLLNWQGSGMSVLEMSHRGKEFTTIAAQAEADLRDLMAIPDTYRVLFLQGGASSQFAMIPLNLCAEDTAVAYVNTGSWSAKAIAEARKYCVVNVVASSEDEQFTSIPAAADWQLNSSAAYLHYTPNETIGGVEFHWVPEVGKVPLVADMSSCILSRPIDISRYGVIYAGAQKNIGPAGLTLVIVHQDLIGHARPATPAMFDYAVHAKAGSMANTPPAFAWYVAGLVFQWIREQGGVEKLALRNQQQAEALYRCIDESNGFYRNPVKPDCRSRMNITFILPRPEMDDGFLQQAATQGLVQLKGHRSVGGMRASLYNAMTDQGVARLIDFMQQFRMTH